MRSQFFLLLILLAVDVSFTHADDTRPNIVIVMADDMGFSDLGCYGSEIETPNLDKLAANGLRFTQFYNTARCCPTRAALLTGLYQHQAGIGHMTGDKGVPSYQGYLNDQCVTIAETLKPAGFTTLMTGKWHVGGKPAQWPRQRGFDRYFGTPSGGGVYFKQSLELRKNVFFVLDDARVDVPADFYVTETFTDYAIEFVEEAAKKESPFFLYLAHIAPHWPLQAKPEEIAKYAGRYDVGWDKIRQQRYEKQQQLGLVSSGWKLSARDEQAGDWSALSEEQQRDLSHRMSVYAAQIDAIDRNVGRLIATLEQAGELDNTLFLFLSDNGCSAEGGPGGFSRGKAGAPIGTALSYASVGQEWANVCDTPFRKFKMNTHEGGIASPLIVHWPKGMKSRGEFSHQVGHVIDLMPTCLDVADATYPKKQEGVLVLPLAGTSLLPALKGDTRKPRTLYWEHEGNRAIRDGDWKLVANHKGSWELYDLKHDRAETKNLAGEMPEKVKSLKKAWKTWADSAGVLPWPVKKPKK